MEEESKKIISIAVRDRVDEAMARDGLSQTAVARESGLSTSAVSQFLTDSYKGNIAAVERKLAKWLTSRDRRSTMASAAIPEASFFEGPAALKIMATLEYAQQAGDMASIIGAPGVGKTRAATEYASRNPNCWIATITPSSSNVAMTLTEICDVIGVHPENFRGARSMAQIIRMRVRGTHGLLIVDEAQHLTLPAIEEIRSIHDATGVGIALLGSYAFQARVSHERLQARTAQIMSRLGMRVSIARPTDGGAIFVIGGQGAGAVFLASVEIFKSGSGRPAVTGTFTTAAVGLASARGNMAAELLASGLILITGGEAGDAALALGEVYSLGI
jgi:DNA transposition AAA+ family ATPase